MSTAENSALRRDLILEQAISQQLNALVRQANTTAMLLQGKQRMEENQLRNLLNVAVEQRAVEVIINFVRYQIARQGSAWGLAQNEFGHQVIRDLRDTLSGFTTTVLERAQHMAGDDTLDFAAQREHIYTRLIILYLGYLNRAFYYAKKTGDFAGLQEVANAR